MILDFYVLFRYLGTTELEIDTHDILMNEIKELEICIIHYEYFVKFLITFFFIFEVKR